MSNNIVRVVLFFAILVLVLVLPWYLVTILLFGLVVYLDFYLEVIFFGFLVDVLYSTREGFVYPATILAFVVLLAVSFVKTRIRT